MTDQTGQISSYASEALDPERPWITDPRELPSRMDWGRIFLNPRGYTPRLHFTRAWTLLFFLQLSILVGPMVLTLVITVAGASTDAISNLSAVSVAVVFVITTLFSFVLHIRRLRDARRSTLFAGLILIPLFLAFGHFHSGVHQKSVSYDKLYAERGEFLANPQAWRDQQLLERQQAQAELEQNGETNSADGGRDRGQRGRRGPDSEKYTAERPLPSKYDYILKPNLGRITSALIPLSAFVAMWSLLWLARQPSRPASEA